MYQISPYLTVTYLSSKPGNDFLTKQLKCNLICELRPTRSDKLIMVIRAKINTTQACCECQANGKTVYSHSPHTYLFTSCLERNTRTYANRALGTIAICFSKKKHRCYMARCCSLLHTHS